jgi:RimJ/RimL family protein N-acetyltransferase
MALTEYAFRHHLGRLEILARPDNPASHRVALAAGYRWEGRRRGVEPDRGGLRHDLVAFARLATDPPGPAPRPLPDLPDGRLTDGVVELRPLGPEHALEVGRLRSLPDVVTHSVPPEPPAAGMIDQMCAEALGRWLAGERAEAAILDAATGALAGTIQLTGLEPPTGQAMIGYDLLPAWRGRGYTTRAVRLLARWAFDQAGLARLIAGAANDNTASQRVLERTGFVREGYERSRLPGPDGTRVDVILYALLRDPAP